MEEYAIIQNDEKFKPYHIYDANKKELTKWLRIPDKRVKGEQRKAKSQTLER